MHEEGIQSKRVRDKGRCVSYTTEPQTEYHSKVTWSACVQGQEITAEFRTRGHCTGNEYDQL